MKFFALTFALTWAAWAAAAAIPARGGPLAALRGAVFLLGVFAPALMALALAARAEGRAAAWVLVGRIGRWRVGAGWYVFALGYMIALKLAAAAVQRIVTGSWPRFGETPLVAMAGAILISTWVQAGEEVGWRGYALPRLAKRFGLGGASLLLGIIWAVWHLPLFFSPETESYGQSFPLYVLHVTALSVAMAWLYWRTGESLLLVMLMHASVNNTSNIVPAAVPGASNPWSLDGSLVGWSTVAVSWAGSAYFLLTMRGASLGTRTVTEDPAGDA